MSFTIWNEEFPADSNVVLGITVADCLPIVLYDKTAGGFSPVHSGERNRTFLPASLPLSAIFSSVAATKVHRSAPNAFLGNFL